MLTRCADGEELLGALRRRIQKPGSLDGLNVHHPQASNRDLTLITKCVEIEMGERREKRVSLFLSASTAPWQKSLKLLCLTVKLHNF
jgi:hypothetical protein